MDIDQPTAPAPVEKKQIKFERRKGETTIIQLTSGEEIVLTVLNTTGTLCELSVEPTSYVKRVLKEEKLQ